MLFVKTRDHFRKLIWISISKKCTNLIAPHYLTPSQRPAIASAARNRSDTSSIALTAFNLDMVRSFTQTAAQLEGHHAGDHT
jgi:hypothetical protein